MANSKDNKAFECPLCHKSMNRKFSFERHRKHCVEKTKGAKSRNFQPYQCPSPKMAQKSAGALIESFHHRITDLYSRGRGTYHEVEFEENENNNESRNKTWNSMLRSIRNINFIHCHSQRKNGFSPISSEVDNVEVGVVRVALVSLASRGSMTRDLDTWYTLPEHEEACVPSAAKYDVAGNKVPLNSILFPISTYLLNILKKIKLDMSEVGSWWFSLEMKQLRLRSNIKAMYLYDLETEEHMVLYRRGMVNICDEYTLNTTISDRIQVWIL